MTEKEDLEDLVVIQQQVKYLDVRLRELAKDLQGEHDRLSAEFIEKWWVFLTAPTEAE